MPAELKLLGREPTEEMWEAYHSAQSDHLSAPEIWRAMFDAAPPVDREGMREKIAARVRRLVGLVSTDFSFDAREAYVATETDAILNDLFGAEQ